MPALEKYHNNTGAIVLALPRGGVPVAWEIATALNIPLDILLVRKIGVPGHEELAMGALASNNVLYWNKEVLRRVGTGSRGIENAVEIARNELRRREETYRGNRPAPELKNRIVILVDDGLATGSTMRAAIDAVRQQQPARVIVAIPIAPPGTVSFLQASADEVICLASPEPFYGVAEWYVNFSQLTDTAVCEMLDSAKKTAGKFP